jgi:hypothetical protein
MSFFKDCYQKLIVISSFYFRKFLKWRQNFIFRFSEVFKMAPNLRDFMFSELLKMAPTFYSSCSNYSTHTPTGPLVMLSKGKTLKFIYELPIFKLMLKILSLAPEDAPYSHQKA